MRYASSKLDNLHREELIMSLDHYVTLGRSGLRVSPLCLGTMTFGQEWGWGANPGDSAAVLARYIELGGNFIDTANFYTHGHSEKIIGDFFANNSSLREQCVIATKFFGSLRQGDPNAGGAGRKSIVAACNESLRRLRTDYIDLYWMHCWDYHTPIEETLRTLDDLVTAGKIRHVGFSDTPAWKAVQAQMLAQLNSWTPAIALQLEYSLLERTIEGDLVPMASEFGLGITPWSPLKSGVLSGAYRRNGSASDVRRGDWAKSGLSDHAYAVIDTLVQIADETSSTPARVALQWVSGRPGITAPIVGARTLAQLEDNLASLQVTLSDQQRNRLTVMTVPKLNFPHGFIKNSAPFRSSGTTINGETAAPNPLAPAVGKLAY